MQNTSPEVPAFEPIPANSQDVSSTQPHAPTAIDQEPMAAMNIEPPAAHTSHDAPEVPLQQSTQEVTPRSEAEQTPAPVVSSSFANSPEDNAVAQSVSSIVARDSKAKNSFITHVSMITLRNGNRPRFDQVR